MVELALPPPTYFCRPQRWANNDKGNKNMKYILMMNASKGHWDEYVRWPPEALKRNVEFMRAFSKELRDAGVFVATEGLDWPSEAKLVRAGKDGAPITDGVFPESKEFLAGYWIIDVDSAEEAYGIAARLSAAPGSGGEPGTMPVEVRRVLSSASDLGI
jgi:hypothetical protein